MKKPQSPAPLKRSAPLAGFLTLRVFFLCTLCPMPACKRARNSSRFLPSRFSTNLLQSERDANLVPKVVLTTAGCDRASRRTFSCVKRACPTMHRAQRLRPTRNMIVATSSIQRPRSLAQATANKQGSLLSPPGLCNDRKSGSGRSQLVASSHRQEGWGLGL